MVVGLGMLNVTYGGLAWMQAFFYGIGAAVAVAMITPGPIVITVGFIGYLSMGDANSCCGIFFN
jgi:chromate transporter